MYLTILRGWCLKDQETLTVIESVKGKRKNLHTLGYYILELYKVLLQIPIATGQT